MRLYSIEFLFVAWSIVYKRVIEPPATLHCRVAANHMVFLGFQTLHQATNAAVNVKVFRSKGGILLFFEGALVSARTHGIHVFDLSIRADC